MWCLNRIQYTIRLIENLDISASLGEWYTSRPAVSAATRILGYAARWRHNAPCEDVYSTLSSSSHLATSSCAHSPRPRRARRASARITRSFVCSVRLCWAGRTSGVLEYAPLFTSTFSLNCCKYQPSLDWWHRTIPAITVHCGWGHVYTRVLPRDHHTLLLVLAYIWHLSCGDGTGGCTCRGWHTSTVNSI